MSRLNQTPWYGALPATGTIGAEDWANSDPTQGWSDGGAAEEIAEQYSSALTAGLSELVSALRGDLSRETQHEIARQVREAVVEYAQSIEFELSVVDGQLVIAAVLQDASGDIRSWIPLGDVMGKALNDARTDPIARAAMDGLLHDMMGQLARQPMPPRTAAPARQESPQAPPRGRQAVPREQAPSGEQAVPREQAVQREQAAPQPVGRQGAPRSAAEPLRRESANEPASEARRTRPPRDKITAILDAEDAARASAQAEAKAEAGDMNGHDDRHDVGAFGVPMRRR